MAKKRVFVSFSQEMGDMTGGTIIVGGDPEELFLELMYAYESMEFFFKTVKGSNAYSGERMTEQHMGRRKQYVWLDIN